MDNADIEKYLREVDIEALRGFEAGTQEAPILFRASVTTKAVAQEGPIQVVASHESEDRMGDVIKVAGWHLQEFRRNPVLLLSHNPSVPPIGRVAKIEQAGKELLADLVFDPGDEKALLIEGKFRRGFMRAVSVGFRPLKFSETGSGGFVFEEQELLELSAVSIPAHPKALAKMLADRKFTIPMPSMEEVVTSGYSSVHPGGSGCNAAVKVWIPGTAITSGPAPVEKTGAVISKTNLDRLGKAIDLLNEVVTSAEKQADPDPDPDPDPDKDVGDETGADSLDTDAIQEALATLREDMQEAE